MSSVQLFKVDDPRTTLQKARRLELWEWAKINQVTEITENPLQENMPAILMRRILQDKGLTNIRIPNRPLGSFNKGNTPANIGVDLTPPGAGQTIDAEADLMAQFRAQTAAPQRSAPKAPVKNELNELRAECKRRGIKMVRGEKAASLRAKLNDKNPA